MAMSVSFGQVDVTVFFPTAHMGITVTGISASCAYITITAVYDDTYYGEYTVRGADYIPPGGTTLNVKDHEVQPGLYVNYRADAYDVNGDLIETDMAAASLQLYGGTILVNGFGYNYTAYVRCVSDPAISIIIPVDSFDEVSYEGKKLGEYNIVGVSNPVVVTDSMGGRKGSFKTYGRSTLNSDDSYFPVWQMQEQILRSGLVLLFQSLFPYQTAIDPMYFVVDSITKRRLTKASRDVDRDDLIIEYTVTFTEVERPTTHGVTSLNRTWDDASAEQPTYVGMDGLYGTWLSLLRGF